MELLPPVTAAELARQSDLVAIRGEMAEIRGEMAELRAELKGEMAELRAEVRANSAQLGARIDAQVPRFLMASLPMTLTLGGLVLAAVKLA